MPSWQAGFITPDEVSDEACSDDPTGIGDDSHVAADPTNLPAGTPCRETPDVSALADPQSGITIFEGGQWFPIGGTSSSTPLWAAMTAEINGSSACSSAPLGLGFVNPLLYQVAASSPTNYADAFSDVTVGNNDNLGVGNGTMFSAGVGYDLASGLGTPRLTDASGAPGLAQQLCAAVTTGAAAAPAVTSLSPGFGPVGGGTAVTIHGSNFGGTQGSVFFGNVSAHVTSWAGTAITVDAPAYHQPPGTSGTTAGSAVVTVTTASAPSESSSPSTVSVYHFVGGSQVSPVPVVDYVGPSAGPDTGGTTASPTGAVRIIGAGFDEAGGVTTVTFGGVSASGVSVVNDNELVVVPPAQTGSTTCANDTAGVCQVQVVVSNAKGPSATEPILPALSGPLTFGTSGALVVPPGCGCEIVPVPSEYDYAPLPTITSESPSFASENGGTTVAITGTGFNLLDYQWTNVGLAGPGASEDFNLVGISPTEVDVSFPGDPNAFTTEPDPVAVSVQTGGGLAAGPSGPGALEFAGVPILTSLSSHLGAVAAPGSITITGAGFDDADLVEFVGQGGFNFLSSTTTHFVVNSDTSITVNVPQFFAIPTDTLVCSVTGCSAVVPADTFVFAYPGRPIVDSVTPASGPAHGGTIVSIAGTLDSEVTAVHFGTIPATVLSQPFASPSGTVVVVAPIGPAGRTVGVYLTTEGGVLVGQPTSANSPVARYTFVESTPSAPRDVVAKAGKGSATVTWQPPVYDGGSAILGYFVVAEPQSTAIKAIALLTSASARAATFPKLQSGVPWIIVVIARSSLGHGLGARSAPVTPT